MTTKNSTASRIRLALRQTLGRLDAWTLEAFNPRYPATRRPER